jgi:hypothetical protein
VILGSVPRGNGRRGTVRYQVTLTVPRRGGWRAWRAVRGDLQATLAEPADPAVIEAEIASERRRGADHVQAVIAATITAADPAEALAVAWETFREAIAGDRLGWDLHAAAAEIHPEDVLAGPPVTGWAWPRRLPSVLRANVVLMAHLSTMRNEAGRLRNVAPRHEPARHPAFTEPAGNNADRHWSRANRSFISPRNAKGPR